MTLMPFKQLVVFVVVDYGVVVVISSLVVVSVAVVVVH